MAEHRAFSTATSLLRRCGHALTTRKPREHQRYTPPKLPARYDLTAHSIDKLLAFAEELNDRPRKSLDWDTPAERLRALLEVS